MRKLKGLQFDNLVPLTEAKEASCRVMETLRSLLDSLPQPVALQANPVDPILAEEAIREGLDKIYMMMQTEVKEESDEFDFMPPLPLGFMANNRDQIQKITDLFHSKILSQEKNESLVQLWPK